MTGSSLFVDIKQPLSLPNRGVKSGRCSVSNATPKISMPHLRHGCAPGHAHTGGELAKQIDTTNGFEVFRGARVLNEHSHGRDKAMGSTTSHAPHLSYLTRRLSALCREVNSNRRI